MKIITFNVNGIRARLNTDFITKIQELDPDVICLQEVRAEDSQIPFSFKENFPNYFLSISNVRKGYAGVMTITKKPVTSTELVFADQTGRAVCTDFGKFKLINVYVPNSGQKLERIDTRVQWMNEFVEVLDTNTIVVGDFNVLPTDLDTNRKNVISGRSYKERECYKKMISKGFVDIWRNFHPETLDYTWYSAQYDSRQNHKGDRNDLCMVGGNLFEDIVFCEIMHDYHCGSDHTPILLEVKD